MLTLLIPNILFFALALVFCKAADLRSHEAAREIYSLLARFPNGSSPACAKRSIRMFNNFMSDSSAFAALVYSGKGLNDLGDYKRCNEAGTSRYMLLQINGLITPLALGICGSIECQEADYAVLKQPIADGMNRVLQSGIFSSPLNHTFLAQDVTFADPRTRQEGERFITSTFFLAVIYFCCILGLSLWGTIIGIIGANTKSSNRATKFAACFDLVRNVKSIFSVPKSTGEDSDLRVFNGVRVLCMLWVILGHTFFHAKNAFPPNVLDIADFLRNFWYSYILNAPYSVDVFFFLGGFLAAYMMARQIRQSGKMPFAYIYAHRILRIFPLFLAVTLIFCFVIPSLGAGPGFHNYYSKVDVDCRKYWKMTLLFVHNFASADDDCMSHTWYIANDMQFFLLTPVLVYIYGKRRMLGYLTLAVLGAASVVANLVVTIYYGLSPSYMNFKDMTYVKHYFEQYYNVPHTRINTYLLGLAAGYLYLEYKSGDRTLFARFTDFLKQSRILRYSLYVLTSTIMFVLLHSIYWFNKYPEDWKGTAAILYLTFSKPVFVTCMFLLLYPAMLGKGWGLRYFLGSSLFSPFARVTFGAYLIHPLIMMYIYWDERKGAFFEYNVLILKFMGFAIVSFAISIVASALFESPIMGIDREFLRKRPAVKAGPLLKQAAVQEGTEKTATTRGNSPTPSQD